MADYSQRLTFVVGILTLCLLGSLWYRRDALYRTFNHVEEVQATTTSASNTAPTTLKNPNLTNRASDILMQGLFSVGDDGTITPEEGQYVADQIKNASAASITPHITHQSDLAAVVPVSSTSVATYHTAMKRIFAPIQGQKEPEIATYGRYVQTRDFQYLIALREMTATYSKIIAGMKQIPVPDDAVLIHLGAINSYQTFTDVLNALIDSNDDPIRSLSLLKSFNDAEKDMGQAFGELGHYYVAHHSY